MQIFVFKTFLLERLATRRSSLIYNTSARHEQTMCDTSDTNATLVTRVQHKCNTSATRTTRVRHEWKTMILITTQVKAYFHTPIFTIRQVKDYNETNNFILKPNFWKCLVSMPKCIWKVHYKNWTCKSYIKTLYTRL